MLHAAHGQVWQDDGQDKIWSSATVDTLWEKDSGVWLIKPNEEACERGLRVNGFGICDGAVIVFRQLSFVLKLNRITKVEYLTSRRTIANALLGDVNITNFF